MPEPRRILLSLVAATLLPAFALAQAPVPAASPPAALEWLKSNPQDPRWPGALRDYAARTQNLGELISLVEGLARVPASVPPDMALEIAAVLEAAGRPEAAMRYYDSAAASEDPALKAQALASSAALACDLGATDKALASVDEALKLPLDGARRAGLAVTRALLRYDLGRRDEAVRDLESLLPSLAAGSPARLQALFALAVHYRGAQAGTAYQKQLQASFPGSPEAALLNAGSPVSLALSPRRLLMASPDSQQAERPAAQPPEAPKPTPDATPQTTLRIQTGSFTVQENATYMVSDLAKAGFQSAVERVTLGATTYFRVVLRQPLPPDEARRTLLRLKEAGFEGFILP